MNLRDHALAKAPYLLVGSEQARAALPELQRAQAELPLIRTDEALALQRSIRTADAPRPSPSTAEGTSR